MSIEFHSTRSLPPPPPPPPPSVYARLPRPRPRVLRALLAPLKEEALSHFPAGPPAHGPSRALLLLLQESQQQHHPAAALPSFPARPTLLRTRRRLSQRPRERSLLATANETNGKRALLFDCQSKKGTRSVFSDLSLFHAFSFSRSPVLSFSRSLSLCVRIKFLSAAVPFFPLCFIVFFTVLRCSVLAWVPARKEQASPAPSVKWSFSSCLGNGSSQDGDPFLQRRPQRDRCFCQHIVVFPA